MVDLKVLQMPHNNSTKSKTSSYSSVRLSVVDTLNQLLKVRSDPIFRGKFSKNIST